MYKCGKIIQKKLMEVRNMAYGRITQKQSEILEYIKSQILNKGYPPSVRDICQAVNLKSTSSVHAHLESLKPLHWVQTEFLSQDRL